MKASAVVISSGRRRLVASPLTHHAALSSRASPTPSWNAHVNLSLNQPPSQLQLHPQRSYHPSLPLLSDNLLSYSPMAQSTPKSSSSVKSKEKSQSAAQGAIWGVDSNTSGGGVWAQTSAKKDKLNELLTDLNGEGVDTGKLGMESLDLAADSEQKLDLEFADGLKCIAKCIDQANSAPEDTALAAQSQIPAIQSMQQTSQTIHETTQQLFQMLHNAAAEDNQWTRLKFEATMKEATRILSMALPSDPSLKKPTAGRLDLNSPLCYIRDFVVPNNLSDNDINTDDSTIQNDEIKLRKEVESLNQITTHAFTTSIHLYKTVLLRALAQTLLNNWDKLTSVTSGDIDRAAVNREHSSPIPTQRETINANDIINLFQSYQSSNCATFVESWWNLIDADNDGMIDQEEMNVVVHLALEVVHLALRELVQFSLEVCPVRRVGLGTIGDVWFLGGDTVNIDSLFNINSSSVNNNKLSWRNRRTELTARKTLIKTFNTTLSRHFRDQVETPHRLRCIYAWANKSHQNSKIDSILVDASEEWGAASNIMGRKRYVELEPKISYEEFREVQKKHFGQLDCMGEEILMSFKEDLWVLQGKGRQNKELRRDCFVFLGVVSLIDFGIGLL